MTTKQELEELEVPAILLANGTIITYEVLKELDDYMPVYEEIEKGVTGRHLVPEHVKLEHLIYYLELANEFANCDYFYADGTLPYEIVFAYVDDFSLYIPDTTSFIDSFIGIYESFDDYASEVYQSVVLSELPEHYQSYFDYVKWSSDLEHDYYVYELGWRKVAIFHN